MMHQLFVDVTGTAGAPSIVFLHGVGASGWMWAPQVEALQDFHCLNVDLPGHGKSAQVEWRSLKETADKVAALIRSEATDGRAHVVGLSLGGYVGLVLVEQYPALVDHLIVSGVTAAPMPNRWLATPQVWLMGLLKNSRRLLAAQARSSHVPPQMQVAFAENLQRMSLQAYRRIVKEAAYFRASPALRQVATPTLVTAGGSETEIITEATAQIARMMPNAAGRLAPGRGHGWNVEAPHLFSAMVRAWITDSPLPRELQPV